MTDESPPLSALQRSTRDDDEDDPERFSESAHKEDMRNEAMFDAEDQAFRAAAEAEKNAEVLDEIAQILRDPDWGVGMLEDIANLVVETGRSTATQFDMEDNPIRTWDRH